MIKETEYLQIRFSCPFHFFYDLKQILSVLVIQHGLGQFSHLVSCYPSLTECDALKTCHLQALSFLQHLYVCRGLGKRIMCSCVEPCEATAKCLHLQLSIFEETA